MDDDLESIDISAEELAAIRNKGQFSRSVSLALSANIDEESTEQVLQDSQSYSAASAGHSQDAVGTVIKGDLNQILSQEESCSLSDSVCVEEDSDNSEDYLTSEEDTLDDCAAVQETPLPENVPPSCPRHRTRLRQRRRRQQLTDFLAPFMRDSDLDEDEDTIVEGGDMLQKVPTLTELCIQKGFLVSGTLPPGLKPVLSQHHSKAKLVTLQLRWLSKNLTLLEKQIKWSLVDALKQHGVKLPVLRRDARSLWRTDWWGNEERPHKEESQWILPASCQSFCVADWKIACLALYINLTLPQRYVDCNHGNNKGASVSEAEQRQYSIDREVQQVKRCLKKRYPKLVKYCFDLAIAYVWWARGRCTKAQEAFKKVASSYPADRESATEQSTLCARHKAMVLVEIGHMLTMFNQPDAAGQFFREAVEIASKNIHPDKFAKLNLQSLALTASVYDQGLMDGHLASLAASLWMAAARQAQSLKAEDEQHDNRRNWTDDSYQEKGHQDAVRAAVESLLHCHVGHLPDSVNLIPDFDIIRNREWLRSAQASLEKLLDERNHFVGFYLSFILAMLNEGVGAERAYHYFLNRTGARRNIPGQLARVFNEDDVRPHPWWLFHEWITEKATTSKRLYTVPLRVLPLVWRRGLVHPSYSDDRSLGASKEQVADIQGISPNLCMTPKGHLSGAMMQNLPPLTAVCMDPLTGQVNFSDSCCTDAHHKWDNYDRYRIDYNAWASDGIKQRFSCNSALPHPNVIFTDPASAATVSLLMPGISRYYDIEAKNQSVFGQKKNLARVVENGNLIFRELQPTITAVYQGTGRQLKVDIAKLVLQARKKNILCELSNLDTHDAQQLKVEDLVDFFITRNVEPSVQWIKNFIRDKFPDQNRLSKSQRQPSVTKTDFAKYVAKLMSYPGVNPLEITLTEVLYVGKATVILLLKLNRHSTFVFLDCSSPERFCQAVVTECQSWVLPDNIDYWKTPEAPANVFFAFTGSRERNGNFSHSHTRFFDDKGNIIEFEEFSKKREQDGSKKRFFSACCGYKIIGTDLTKTKVTSCDFQSGLEFWSSPLQRITELAVSHNTVYVSTGEGIYALDVNKLERLVIIQPKPNLYIASSNDLGILIHLESSISMKVLGPRDAILVNDGGIRYNRTFLALDNHLLILQRRRITDKELHDGEASPNVLEVQDIMVPGKPTELCYINEQVGFVVSATVFTHAADPYYRENLYWFNGQGNIVAIHPFIGGGLHDFLPVYLKSTGEEDSGRNKEDLYLYFADGLGALCCIKLDALNE